MGELNRGERLQIMLMPEELRVIDTWRFAKRMPSRAAAIRELLKRGLLPTDLAKSRMARSRRTSLFFQTKQPSSAPLETSAIGVLALAAARLNAAVCSVAPRTRNNQR